jgi:hypothetical protein
MDHPDLIEEEGLLFACTLDGKGGAKFLSWHDIDIRQKAVLLRRYIAPQREALGTLVSDPPDWFHEDLRPHLRETSDKLMRYLEELDATRERAMVVKDDIANQLSEASNKTLYVLAIVSAIFLPLAFLTDLFGHQHRWDARCRQQFCVLDFLRNYGCLLVFRAPDF